MNDPMNDDPMKEQTGNKPNRDELRQQLWELSYGLLEADDEAAMRGLIKSDPAIARLYSEVRLQADLVGRAARVEDSALQISAGPDAKVSKGSTRTSKTAAGKTWQETDRRGWSGNWLAIGGTVALLVLLSFGLNQPQTVTTSVAQADYYFTQITAPANTPEGVSQTVEIRTRDIDDNGRAAELAVRLVDEAGREIFRQPVKTGRDGRGEVQLPGDLVRQGVRLEAIPADERGVVSAELQVAAEQPRTLMLLEKPTAKPGDKVGFSMVDVKQFSKQTTTPATSEMMVENRRGGDVVEPMWVADPQTGVISGEFSLPRDAAVEVEQLAMRRRALPLAAKETEKQDQAERKATRDENLKAVEKVERQALMLDRAELQNANGAVGRGLANRGADKAGALNESGKRGASGGGAPFGAAGSATLQQMRSPAPPAAADAAVAPAPPPAPAPLAPAEIAAAPAAPAPIPATPGAAPGSGNPEREKLDPLGSPLADGQRKDLQSNPKPKADAAPGADAKAELQLPAELVGEDLVLIARRHGTLLARREYAAFRDADRKLDLPPEVDGRVDIELYRASDPQQPVYRQQIVRVASRALHFDVTGLKDHYQPGEKVALQVRVLDEKGEPVAAAVGVRVWNDVAAQASRAPLLLVDALAREKQTGPAEKARELLAQVDALAAAPLAKAQLPEAAKSLAVGTNAAVANPSAGKPGDLPGGPGGIAPQAAAAPAAAGEVAERLERRLEHEAVTAVDAPVHSSAWQMVAADNRATVQQEYETAVAAEQSQRLARIQAIGRILVWGGAGLMLLVGLLLIARRPLQPIVWIPAVGLATVTLVLGLAWFVPSQPVGWDLARLETALPVPQQEIANHSVENGIVAPRAEQLPMIMPAAPPTAEETPAVAGDAPINGIAGGGAPQPPQPAKPGVEKNKARNNDSLEENSTDKLLTAPLAANLPQAKKALLKEDGLERNAAAPFESGADELAPDSLFWRPLSLVGNDGLLTIEFTMPTTSTNYRLLLDAIGHGRIGGEQLLLISRE